MATMTTTTRLKIHETAVAIIRMNFPDEKMQDKILRIIYESEIVKYPALTVKFADAISRYSEIPEVPLILARQLTDKDSLSGIEELTSFTETVSRDDIVNPLNRIKNIHKPVIIISDTMFQLAAICAWDPGEKEWLDDAVKILNNEKIFPALTKLQDLGVLSDERMENIGVMHSNMLLSGSQKSVEVVTLGMTIILKLGRLIKENNERKVEAALRTEQQ
ncbi:MAG: hypothetical protein ABR981_05175 [Candidatus Micrarchaeaceae archaeon]|jgi:hypothetical protein